MKTKKLPRWAPPAPTIESVADVRKLHGCTYCRRLGSNLLVVKVRKLPAQRHHDYAHAYCFIRAETFEAFAVLPREEISKITVNEIVALGIPYTRIEAALRAAK